MAVPQSNILQTVKFSLIRTLSHGKCSLNGRRNILQFDDNNGCADNVSNSTDTS